MSARPAARSALAPQADRPEAPSISARPVLRSGLEPQAAQPEAASTGARPVPLPAGDDAPPARTGADAWIRPLHRWLAVVFSVVAVANIVALVLRLSAPWLGLLALVPLIPMMATGLWMFAQPYRSARRRRAA